MAAAASGAGMLMAGLVLMAAVPQVKYYALLSLLLTRPVVMLLGRLYPSVREKE